MQIALDINAQCEYYIDMVNRKLRILLFLLNRKRSDKEMAKTLIVKFPKLKAKMAFNGTTVKDLSKVLEISEDSVRRRLRGDIEFTESEIVALIIFYQCPFEELFECAMA